MLFFSAPRRQLHFPSQPWSRWTHLPAMWGKSPSIFGSLSFVNTQVECLLLIFLTSGFYMSIRQLVITSSYLSLSAPGLVPMSLQSKTTLLLPSHTRSSMWDIKSDLCYEVCVTMEVALMEILIYFVLEQQKITFISWQ